MTFMLHIKRKIINTTNDLYRNQILDEEVGDAKKKQPTKYASE